MRLRLWFPCSSHDCSSWVSVIVPLQQRFAPTEKKVRGVIFLCAGYADTVSWLPTDRAVRFAQAGFVVYGLDYEVRPTGTKR